MKRIVDISDDTFNILKNMVEANCVDPYSLADIIVNKSIPLQEYEFLSTLMQSVMTTEQLKEVFQKIIAEKNRWIPVSEGLPEEKINPYTTDFDEVLCTTDWGDVQAFKFGTPILHHEPHFWLGGAIMDEHIIAWQYKPEPYTEKKITNFYTKRFNEVN